MALTEEARHHLYERLEEVLGHEEATTLMEHLPPVGWADVATKEALAAHQEATRQDIAIVTVKLDGLGTELDAIRRNIEGLRAETASNMNELRAETASTIKELRAETASNFEGLRAEMAGNMNELRAGTASNFEAVRAEARRDLEAFAAVNKAEHEALGLRLMACMDRCFRAQTWRLVVAMVAFAAVVTAGVRV